MKTFTIACFAGLLFAATPACVSLDDDDDEDSVTRTTTVERTSLQPASSVGVTTQTQTVQPVIY